MDQDVLFILIIVITVIINIVKAVKKKGQAAAVQPPKPVAADPVDFEDFEDILKKVMNPSKRSVSHTEQEAESLETLKPLGGSLESISEYEWQPPVYTTSTAMSELSVPAPSDDLHEDELHKPSGSTRKAGGRHRWHPGDPIDIRTAFIYQTILERPNV
ncbi:MAG TPA: hypothetical protein P5228_03095 [Bacteroidales bacterium]|nr:hypothetical protein [Bacteroidales bacterium]HRZ48782.1 hypothetical protein [Bacteroidales bacterium]